MATDTFASRQISSVETGDVIDDFFESGEAGLKPAMAGKISSNGRTVSIADVNTIPDCIILHRSGYQADATTIRDLDDAYDNGDDNVRVARLIRNPGKEFWVFLKANVASQLGKPYITADNGQVNIFTYTEASRASDTLAEVVGKMSEYHAASSDTKLRKIIVGK